MGEQEWIISQNRSVGYANNPYKFIDKGGNRVAYTEESGESSPPQNVCKVPPPAKKPVQACKFEPGDSKSGIPPRVTYNGQDVRNLDMYGNVKTLPICPINNRINQHQVKTTGGNKPNIGSTISSLSFSADYIQSIATKLEMNFVNSIGKNGVYLGPNNSFIMGSTTETINAASKYQIEITNTIRFGKVLSYGLAGASIMNDSINRYQDGYTVGQSITISTYANVFGFAAATFITAAAPVSLPTVIVIGGAAVVGWGVSEGIHWLYDNVDVVKDGINYIGKKIDDGIKFVESVSNFIDNLLKGKQ